LREVLLSVVYLSEIAEPQEYKAEQTNYAVTGELRILAFEISINTRVLFCTQWRLFV
jgi:hypothetical protein